MSWAGRGLEESLNPTLVPAEENSKIHTMCPISSSILSALGMWPPPWDEGLMKRLNFSSIILLALRRWKVFSLLSYFYYFEQGIVGTSSTLFVATNCIFFLANFIPLRHPQICLRLSEWSQEKDFSSHIVLGFLVVFAFVWGLFCCVLVWIGLV